MLLPRVPHRQHPAHPRVAHPIPVVHHVKHRSPAFLQDPNPHIGGRLVPRVIHKLRDRPKDMGVRLGGGREHALIQGCLLPGGGRAGASGGCRSSLRRGWRPRCGGRGCRGLLLRRGLRRLGGSARRRGLRRGRVRERVWHSPIGVGVGVRPRVRHRRRDTVGERVGRGPVGVREGAVRGRSCKPRGRGRGRGAAGVGALRHELPRRRGGRQRAQGLHRLVAPSHKIDDDPAWAPRKFHHEPHAVMPTPELNDRVLPRRRDNLSRPDARGLVQEAEVGRNRSSVRPVIVKCQREAQARLEQLRQLRHPFLKTHHHGCHFAWKREVAPQVDLTYRGLVLVRIPKHELAVEICGHVFKIVQCFLHLSF
mmetsp:Transcript_22310/g.53355  ORF Transcript_22310/g.53355 Transcript_22310/m.53355 type:complete len:366 (-) Transcript_22310:239-1336(-)